MKFFKVIAVCVCAAVSLSALAAFNSGTCFEEGEIYTFVCRDASRGCRIVTVESGAALKKLALKDINGESTTYASLNIADFLNEVSGEIIFTEELSDSVNYYCTADLPYSTKLYGQEINLHICVKEQGVTVASPIIFGGY